MEITMNTKNYFTLGMAALSLSCGSLALGATIDNFDTFTGVNNPLKGFDLTTSAGTVQDNTAGAPEAVPTALDPTPDTDFGGLLRRAQLTWLSGGGDSTFNNNGVSGKASWGNEPGVRSTAVLRYDWTVNQNFGVAGANYVNIDFLFSQADFAGTITIDVYSVAFNPASPHLTGTLNVGGGIGSPTTLSYAISGFTGVNGGLSSIWDSVKVIRFELNSPTTSTDWQIDSIGLSVSQVPEAQTMVPVIAFAGVAGVLAWRRRASK